MDSSYDYFVITFHDDGNEGSGMSGKCDVKQVIVVRKDLNMRKGKFGSQVAHAAMKFILDNNEAKKPNRIEVELNQDESVWCRDKFTKIVVGCNSQDELENLILKAQLQGISVYPIIDSGKTEFGGEPTLTCAAFGPCLAEEIDNITGHLKLM